MLAVRLSGPKPPAKWEILYEKRDTFRIFLESKPAHQNWHLHCPLVRKLNEINEKWDTYVRCHEGEVRKVRFHFLWAKMDLQALSKVAGLNGLSAKKACYYCFVPTFLLLGMTSYYFPSYSQEESHSSTARRRKIVKLFDPDNTTLSSPDESRNIIWSLRSNSVLSDTRRKSLSISTGIRREIFIHALPFIIAFDSFPIDTMILCYNIAKDLMQIFKGDNSHLRKLPGYPEDLLYVSRDSCDMIGAELRTIDRWTEGRAFGTRPRDTSRYLSWKYIEYKQFVLHYLLVASNGHISRRHPDGLKKFTLIHDLWSRAHLKQEDVVDLIRLVLEFYGHYEALYFRDEPKLAGLSKLTVHLLLHRHDKLCGFPVYYNHLGLKVT